MTDRVPYFHNYFCADVPRFHRECKMRNAIGILLMVAGVAFGVYVGLWLCLIGGIVQIIDSAKLTPVDSWGVAFGIARVLCTGVAGTLTAVVAVFPGFAMLKA